MSDETKTTDNAPEVTPTEPAQISPQADGPAAEAPAETAKTDAAPSPAAAGGTFTGGGEGKAPEARVGGRPPRGGQQGGQRGGDRGRGRGRGRGRDEGADDGIESNVIRIYRCSKVVKGGRTFSFAALVVAGDRAGSVGIGYGKANEVPSAVEKATKEARRTMKKIPMVGTTIPHPALGASGTSRVQLIPANPGTGVTAGKTVRPLLELAGVTDVLTKAYGSTSPKNLLKATIDALRQLRSADQVKQMRGVDLPDSAGTLTVAS
ncbi:MAG: 30S ribosomal protein S5 [Planctomycetota bacterium]